MLNAINDLELERRIKDWLEEDMPFGDITTEYILDKSTMGCGQLIAKEKGILCGVDVFKKVYHCLDPSVAVIHDVVDGDMVSPGQLIGEIKGSMNSILKGERVGLNILQHLSGIATRASLYAKEVEGLQTVIVDTRKTTPGFRSLEKYAVRVGGCVNHRYSLSDAVLIKDNHIAGAGSIMKAVKAVRQHIPHTVKVEVEVETLDEVNEALQADVDIIMLDNMTVNEMSKAVQYVRNTVNKSISLEASGNMTLERIREVAKTGVDIISVGALTHSVKALDISLKFKK